MYIRLTILYALEKLKPSDSKGSRWYYGGAGVLRTYVRITKSYKRLITDLHMMLL